MNITQNNVILNQDNQPQYKSKRKKRNIIWFNPPYSKFIKTNVGKKFLEALDTCFGQNKELHKLFNRHNTKVSYKCGPNIKNTINSHNRKIFQEFKQAKLKKKPIVKRRKRKNKRNSSYNCNCEAQECPLNG